MSTLGVVKVVRTVISYSAQRMRYEIPPRASVSVHRFSLLVVAKAGKNRGVYEPAPTIESHDSHDFDDSSQQRGQNPPRPHVSLRVGESWDIPTDFTYPNPTQQPRKGARRMTMSDAPELLDIKRWLHEPADYDPIHEAIALAKAAVMIYERDCRLSRVPLRRLDSVSWRLTDAAGLIRDALAASGYPGPDEPSGRYKVTAK